MTISVFDEFRLKETIGDSRKQQKILKGVEDDPYIFEIRLCSYS
jgi:hypothetical protein